jgi:hypothetical protein
MCDPAGTGWAWFQNLLILKYSSVMEARRLAGFETAKSHNNEKRLEMS